MLVNYFAVGAYAVLIMIIGLLGMRKNRSYNDFLLGGGKVGPWMTAFPYGTAYFSAVLFSGTFHRFCRQTWLGIRHIRTLDSPWQFINRCTRRLASAWSQNKIGNSFPQRQNNA